MLNQDNITYSFTNNHHITGINTFEIFLLAEVNMIVLYFLVIIIYLFVMGLSTVIRNAV